MDLRRCVLRRQRQARERPTHIHTINGAGPSMPPRKGRSKSSTCDSGCDPAAPRSKGVASEAQKSSSNGVAAALSSTEDEEPNVVSKKARSTAGSRSLQDRFPRLLLSWTRRWSRTGGRPRPSATRRGGRRGRFAEVRRRRSAARAGPRGRRGATAAARSRRAGRRCQLAARRCRLGARRARATGRRARVRRAGPTRAPRGGLRGR